MQELASKLFVVFGGLSLLVGYLTVRYWEYIVRLFPLLAAVFVLGILVMFFDLDLGVKMALYSFLLFCGGLLLHGIGVLVTAIIVAPFALIWLAIGDLFKSESSKKKKG